MKKILAFFILLFIINISFPLNVFAISKAQLEDIGKIENELFGFDYLNDNTEDRIKRIEDVVYGKSFSGDLSNRLKKISGDILVSQISKEMTPSEYTYREQEEVADSSVNYPILDEIETKIFNKTFKERDFHTRIVTIERKLFGKIYDVEDYSTRMDRIKAEVLPERLAREKVFGYDNSDVSINSTDLSALNSNQFIDKMPYGQENYTRPYANYGDYSSSYSEIPNNLDDELSQLEYSAFGTEFSNEDTQTRIKRLNSAHKAQKSSRKYDSQKFNQRMSSFMEIGAMLLMILAMVL